MSTTSEHTSTVAISVHTYENTRIHMHTQTYTHTHARTYTFTNERANAPLAYYHTQH